MRRLEFIKTIPDSLFYQDYRFVSFDIASLFTNEPLKRTIEIILKRVFEDKNQSIPRLQNVH